MSFALSKVVLAGKPDTFFFNDTATTEIYTDGVAPAVESQNGASDGAVS